MEWSHITRHVYGPSMKKTSNGKDSHLQVAPNQDELEGCKKKIKSHENMDQQTHASESQGNEVEANIMEEYREDME